MSNHDLILENLPVVGYIVGEYMSRVPSHVRRDELTSAGMLGLVKAARDFDPKIAVPFRRYASLRIRGEIVDELRSHDWATRSARKTSKAVLRATESLTAALGRTPSTEEIAEAMGISDSDVRAANDIGHGRVASLDYAIDGVGFPEPADGAPTPEEHLLQQEKSRYLDAAVQCLPDKLRDVVEATFYSETGVTEFARGLGVTQTRVSQLRSDAAALLRHALDTHLDPEMLPAPGLSGATVNRRRAAYSDAVGQRAQAGRAPARPAA